MNIKVPSKILLMQSPIAVDPGRLQAVLAPDIKQKLLVSEQPLAQGVEHAQEHALAAMISVLSKQSGLILVAPQAQENQFINQIQVGDFGSAITQEEADQLRANTGADALLRFSITDYGLTPRSWRNGYITFEVTSTLALATVIAYSGSAAAKAAAGVYLVQETAEETAEAYAGFEALDELSRPVRIEAELIRLNPVATIWTSSDTGLSDVKLSRIFRKVEAGERDRQLEQSTDNAVKDVITDFSDTFKNIKPFSE